MVIAKNQSSEEDRRTCGRGVAARRDTCQANAHIFVPVLVALGVSKLPERATGRF
tara:strand:+ start:706 stop:870 length:165 start_codon:yes stop_codon:yes gene_type:complete